MSPRRKRIGVVLGLLLLVGLGRVIWPLINGPHQMQDFCNSLAAGTSVLQIRAQATQQGYRISLLIDGRAFVYDSGSFGRFICELQFSPNGLVSATYLLND